MLTLDRVERADAKSLDNEHDKGCGRFVVLQEFTSLAGDGNDVGVLT